MREVVVLTEIEKESNVHERDVVLPGSRVANNM